MVHLLASRAWAGSQSYYALVEILDAHFDPDGRVLSLDWTSE